MVPSTMSSMLGSTPVCDAFCIFCIRRDFYLSTISDRLRSTRRARGLRRLLRRAEYISAPCGWEQGAKWSHIRVGSGPDGIRRAKPGTVLFTRFKGECSEKLIDLPYREVRMGSGEPRRVLFCFPVSMENVPRNLSIYRREDSTAKIRHT